MPEVAAWLLAACGGGAVGALYFAGLWWTLRRVREAGRPAALVAISSALRGALAALALFGVAGGDALRLLAALGGFLLARAAFVRAARAGAAPLRAARATGGED